MVSRKNIRASVDNFVNNVAVKRNNRILIVDDNQSIHADFRKILAAGAGRELEGIEARLFASQPKHRPSYEIDSAFQGEEALALVEKARDENRPYSLVFVDVRMPPGWDGVETTSRLWKACPDAQIVLCTAYSDYSWDEMFAKLGASDGFVILKKPFDAVEVLQLAATLTEKYRLTQEARIKVEQLESLVEERTRVLRKTNEHLQTQIWERQRATEALRESEERYQLMFRENPLPMWVFDLQSLAFLAVNEAAVRGYGYSEEELLTMSLRDLHLEEDLPALQKRILENSRQPADGLITRHRKKNGSVITVEISSRVILFNGREVKLALANDITERKRLEAQFLRAQRMEGIGTLATGMAHDLNNILSPILISAGTMRWDLTNEEKETAINRIEVSVKRGAAIIQQVLTFGRGMEGDRQVIQAGEVIEEVLRLGREEFPSNIVVTSQIDPALWPILGDNTQMHQMLLNLCTNARDAMNGGGKLSISARNAVLTEVRSALPSAIRPGSYVLLQVTDTGCGIAQENWERIFEPFFTTKEIGKGIGLGLSTVLGIVKSHQGGIMMESEPGKGTTFRVLIPASCETVHSATPAALPDLPAGNGEVVLIIDDDPGFVASMTVPLETHGYRIMGVKDGSEALAAIHLHGAAIDIVVTDINMPEMDGVEMIRKLKSEQPTLQFIVSTRMANEKRGGVRAGELEGMGISSFLPKIYSAEELRNTLQNLPRIPHGSSRQGRGPACLSASR